MFITSGILCTPKFYENYFILYRRHIIGNKFRKILKMRDKLLKIPKNIIMLNSVQISGNEYGQSKKNIGEYGIHLL